MSETNRTPTLAMAACLLATLALIGCSSSVVREPSRGGRPAAPAQRPSVAKPGATVVVQRGEGLYRIAANNGIQMADLAAWNGLSPPYNLYPGQRLKLYPPGRGGSSSAGSSSAGSGGSRPSAPAPAPAAPIDSGIRWRWPADGPLLGRYVANEPTKQGIDIGGAPGTPVRAAADGVVVYSGTGLVGYGELIIVKHNEQWLSAYGHNRKRLVNEGQLVKSGQQIAEMGRSGAARDQLHFEVRYNAKPVDPLLYLPAK
ncbi:outer membrane antigenic lipoprotein [Lysobacter enzymogenes]|uniref:Outer membrane antigenic lipoprotein n=1 Tax=Lysobacter enzymogenes TaxID=69 RepID=A0A0S2DES5_LYSEN|nr:outer membrane antigenic lipoprotein [Lysobacter enzymogenes]QCW25593.1 LysM peptidoglycan-binding domain-containing protein [Lysobacter enzymogenes]